MKDGQPRTFDRVARRTVSGVSITGDGAIVRYEEFPVSILDTENLASLQCNPGVTSSVNCLHPQKACSVASELLSAHWFKFFLPPVCLATVELSRLLSIALNAQNRLLSVQKAT